MNIKLIGDDTSEVRIDWVIKQLKYLPKGIRILDAGAGQRQFEPHCSHLQYVAQDFAQYDGGEMVLVCKQASGTTHGSILCRTSRVSRWMMHHLMPFYVPRF